MAGNGNGNGDGNGGRFYKELLLPIAHEAKNEMRKSIFNPTKNLIVNALKNEDDVEIICVDEEGNPNEMFALASIYIYAVPQGKINSVGFKRDEVVVSKNPIEAFKDVYGGVVFNWTLKDGGKKFERYRISFSKKHKIVVAEYMAHVARTAKKLRTTLKARL